jgi:transcriptional regulator with XRE-family HTH domain
MNRGTFLKKIGRNVAKAREAKGYSQDDVAAESDVSRSSIDRIERGVTDPRAATLLKLAEALSVPVKRFFDFDA